jgi:hypothetical protein
MLRIRSRIILTVFYVVNGNWTIYAPSFKGVIFVTEARCGVEHVV